MTTITEKQEPANDINPDNKLGREEREILMKVFGPQEPLDYPTELMEMANGCVVERYIIPDEDKQKVLDTLFPFFEKPSLDDESLDIHCHKKFKVRDFMVTHEGDGNFIVSPYYAEAGGTVLDWVKFDDIAHYCGVSVNTLRK